MNWHLTVGRKIPSVYLRVFSDGSFECHAIQYSGRERDEVKKAILTPGGLAQLRQLIDESILRGVEPRYKLNRMVVDSWMEWEINIPDPARALHIVVAHPSVGFPMTREEAYPPALLELGCSIWKLRNDVFADARPYAGCDRYRSVH